MLLKKKNIVIEISDENKDEIKKHLDLGYNEYKKENIANVKNNSNK